MDKKATAQTPYRKLLQGNPCAADCPQRTPGCCCEKRRAWLREHKDRKQQALAAKGWTVADDFMKVNRDRRKRKSGKG